MICLKPGAGFLGASPEIVFALTVADGVYERHGVAEMWVTSITDTADRRSSRSRHRVGLAADLRRPDRFNQLPEPHTIDGLGDALSDALGGQVAVVIEADHIHIQII